MSDDLVKMARLAQRDERMSTGALYGDLADRIEELEADLRKVALDYLAAQGQASEAYQAQLAAEAKLEKVKAAFRINMMHALPDYTHEMFDREYGKITGETDE